LVKRVTFTIPDEWESRWEKLLEIYGTDADHLVRELIKHEVAIIETKEQKEALMRIEDAAKDVYEVAGAEGLEKFADAVRLMAKKIVEAGER
jgi:hypothetical protein